MSKPVTPTVPAAKPPPHRVPFAIRMLLMVAFLFVAALSFFEFRAQNKSLAADALVDAQIELMNQNQDFVAKPEAFRRLIGRLPAHISQNDFELVETFTWEGPFRRFHLTLTYRFGTDPQDGTLRTEFFESTCRPQSRLKSD